MIHYIILSYYSLLDILSINFYLKQSSSINLSAPMISPNFQSQTSWGLIIIYKVSRFTLIGELAKFFQEMLN